MYVCIYVLAAFIAPHTWCSLLLPALCMVNGSSRRSDGVVQPVRTLLDVCASFLTQRIEKLTVIAVASPDVHSRGGLGALVPSFVESENGIYVNRCQPCMS